MISSIQTALFFTLALVLLVSTAPRCWHRLSRPTHKGIAALSAICALARFNMVMSPDIPSGTDTPTGVCLFLAVLLVGFASMVLFTLAFTISLDKTLNPHRFTDSAPDPSQASAS